MLKNILMAVCLSIPAVSLADSLAYEATELGKQCKETRLKSCVYKVGKDLEFSIDGIGNLGVGISFVRANHHGDYYAKFGLQHGCVIVSHGKNSPMFMQDYAFVSPLNGKVYKSWNECKLGT